MMFSVDYWNVPFSYRDFPFAHTVKEKHPQLFIIPLIVIPEINHLYLRQQANELQTIFIIS